MALAYARTILLACLSLHLGVASAITVSEDFQTQFASNTLYVWTDDPASTTIGNVVLGNLPVGQWRYLGAGESF